MLAAKSVELRDRGTSIDAEHHADILNRGS
jgi:hypothetical protein